MRRLHLYFRPKRFSCLHRYDRLTITRLDDWYDARSGLTRAFAEPLLMEIVDVASNDALLNNQMSFDLLRSVLKRCAMSEVEGLNDKSPAVIGWARSDQSFTGL